MKAKGLAVWNIELLEYEMFICTHMYLVILN